MEILTNKLSLKRLTAILISMLAVGALTVTAHTDNRGTKVKGKGIATMEAAADDDFFGAFEEGDLFVDNDFDIKVRVRADGSASGKATFVFGEDFPSLWGADFVTLECEIETATVHEDGTVVLEGISFEQDFADGVVIFEEFTPFEIVVDPTGLFTLRWCELPTLDLELTRGRLKVK